MILCKYASSVHKALTSDDAGGCGCRSEQQRGGRECPLDRHAGEQRGRGVSLARAARVLVHAFSPVISLRVCLSVASAGLQGAAPLSSPLTSVCRGQHLSPAHWHRSKRTLVTLLRHPMTKLNQRREGSLLRERFGSFLVRSRGLPGGREG